ncbi:uncharacterized protein BO97DRAFT_430613 [Aspergillus homomorphus CBS 101889]|uniref:Rhodopsin domain-containing protein n=1 Tax=Aspergillus homomorphus (strain CBS 101889) TaxID=1450537 RepID=A0A395IER9_ASPHC|nr:hypothetical protein BO97DRAFT_430613 [Aspergillus homomorphus CBS 101889]RAL17658.1 hypothetical protein BO97DRAFT_430613 [Aspergillus homomorphus CBS 101889]
MSTTIVLTGSLDAKVSRPVFLGVLWTFTASSTVFVVARVVIRLKTFRRLFVDDLFVLLAWILSVITGIVWRIKAPVLYELYALSAGKATFTPDVIPQLDALMRFEAPFMFLFYTTLWCVKLSFMAFFYKLGSKIDTHRKWWWVVLIITLVVWVISVGDIDYQCSLGGIEFIFEQCNKPYHIRWQNGTFWANCAGDVITDLLILSIPTLIVWNVRVSFTKKLILLGIFATTIIIVAVAIIRVVTNHALDHNMDMTWLWMWSFIEMGTAIMISCVASFRQLFVTSQNQHLYGQSAYHSPGNPLLMALRSRQTSAHAGGDKPWRDYGDSYSQKSETAFVVVDHVHSQERSEVTSIRTESDAGRGRFVEHVSL